MVEELSGVTHARLIKMHPGKDEIQTNTVVLTFDSPKSPSRIRAEYLTLHVRPVSLEGSQQRLPRMATEVPLLPHPRGEKPRRILRLSVPREQQ
ncbi:hypothetical protein PoB_004253300 [Plakobranchus ocellatus]|uniref:Uncharacterized protein n=1 Tax=Plakobranchus ocellatus TaxID=259542 RepID=A0AAV4B8V7_9GAST|nr:hypothetical protein PoB_004253300 [Plakobranchus ocellatus]